MSLAEILGALFVVIPTCVGCLGFFIHHWISGVDESIKKLTEALAHRVHKGEFREEINKANTRIDRTETAIHHLEIRMVAVEQSLQAIKEERDEI